MFCSKFGTWLVMNLFYALLCAGLANRTTPENLHDKIILHEADLEDCLQQALKNNRKRPASRFAVAMAEAQHRQALASYWPQISAKGGFQRLDESPDYIFPSSEISLPGGGVVTPLGFLSVGPITIPEQHIKLQDKESFRASAQASWLLYDGGIPLCQ